METDSIADPSRLVSTDPNNQGEAHYLLRIYLRDHDAGSAGGVRLIQRSHHSNTGTAFEPGLARLESAIRQDQADLGRIMTQLQISPSRTRRAMAWCAATLGGLKLNGHLFKYSPLSRVVELEALSAAVTAKLGLWYALEGLSDGQLESSLLAGLQREAQAQLASLSKMHHEATRLAFVAGSQR